MVVTQGGAPAASWREKSQRLAIRSIAVVGAVLAATVMSGCSGAGEGPVAVRVGDVSIGSDTVNHWASAIKLGSTVGASLGQKPGTPHERALAFLISANWLIGEAAEQGLAVTDTAADRVLKERAEAVGGRSAFEKELASIGQTSEDVKLEIKAELAVRALHDLVTSRMPIVAATQEVMDVYHRDIARFRVPEQRRVDLIEAIESRAAAVALGGRLGPGARFAKRALHESVARQTPAEAAKAGNAELVRGIFAATPGKVAPPARFDHRWVLIVVRGRI